MARETRSSRNISSLVIARTNVMLVTTPTPNSHASLATTHAQPARPLETPHAAHAQMGTSWSGWASPVDLDAQTASMAMSSLTCASFATTLA